MVPAVLLHPFITGTGIHYSFSSTQVLTWRKLFTAVVEYCVRYSTVIAEIAHTAGAGSVAGAVAGGALRGMEERLMNSHEADILVAFLGLLRCAPLLPAHMRVFVFLVVRMCVRMAGAGCAGGCSGGGVHRRPR